LAAKHTQSGKHQRRDRSLSACQVRRREPATNIILKNLNLALAPSPPFWVDRAHGQV